MAAVDSNVVSTPKGKHHAPIRLGHPFFEQSAVRLSRLILGKIMIVNEGDAIRRARVVEVEAYSGPKDLASHSSRGRTARTEVMFGPPGRAYVYFIYGMHWMFNITCGREGAAHAVLVRAAEPLDGWEADLTGPARLAKAFGITGKMNRCDLTAEQICFESDGYRPRIIRTPRIGIDYAKHWKDRLLRFVDVRNPVARRLRNVPHSTAPLVQR